MSIDIIIGATDTPVSTESLIESIQRLGDIGGVLYTGYPILGSTSTTTSVDALLMTPDHGIVLCDVVEGVNVANRENFRDELYNLLYSKLVGYKELTQKRGILKLPIHVITYSPAWTGFVEGDTSEVCTSQESLLQYLELIRDEPVNELVFKKYLEVIQAVTKLKSKPSRIADKEDSKGNRLNKLEESIANLDRQQSKAVIETTTGIQRIRGLAGSGKTIVLALKVAYLHSKYPHWNIAVTFYTRSLKDQFIEYITKFTIEHKHEEPDWSKVKILQAWGGSRESGLYYQYCTFNNIEYLDYGDAKERYRFETNLLEKLCIKALSETRGQTAEKYDMILIDEAQDFSEAFLIMAYKMLRSHDLDNEANKRLIYAYDELQRLSQNTLRNPKEFLGEKIDFNNAKNKPKQDIVLDKCYRNSAPVLVTAHALGFGIYRQKGPVTMFKEKEIWLDVGYQVHEGTLDFGERVVLSRDSTTSPEFYKKIDPIDELIKVTAFEDVDVQLQWVADQIEKNIKEEELDPKDIIVIHPNPKSAKNELAPLRSLLFNKQIKSHIAGVTTSPDRFFIDGSVACTSIYRAKGNEAPMVYMINSEYCYGGIGLITRRNTLFTGITRSKAWIRVTGVGSDMSKLVTEFTRIKENSFTLDFIYPTLEEMDTLNIIHRDLTVEEAKSIKEGNHELKSLIGKIENDVIRIEDLSPKQLANLKRLLNENK